VWWKVLALHPRHRFIWSSEIDLLAASQGSLTLTFAKDRLERYFSSAISAIPHYNAHWHVQIVRIKFCLLWQMPLAFGSAALAKQVTLAGITFLLFSQERIHYTVEGCYPFFSLGSSTICTIDSAIDPAGTRM